MRSPTGLPLNFKYERSWALVDGMDSLDAFQFQDNQIRYEEVDAVSQVDGYTIIEKQGG